jgi:hypothetical protein
MAAGFGLASRLLVNVTFHNGSGCSRFQFGTATETFFGNVPFHPADFDTLEIEIQKAPAVVRGRFCFAGPVFSLTGLADGLAASKPFDWMNLAISPLDGRI